MCLAIPAKVVELGGEGRAMVEQNGSTFYVSTIAVPDVRIGDYLLINLGVATKRMSQREAAEITAVWDQLSATLAEDFSRIGSDLDD